jgi:hypothetical protein
MKDNNLNHLIGRIVTAKELGPHEGPFIIKEILPVFKDYPKLVRVESLNWVGFSYGIELEKLEIKEQEVSELILALNDIGL